MNKFLHIFKKMNNPGLYFPMLFNPVTKLPSMTLLFAYTTFILAIVSTVILHFKTDLIVATSVSIIFWVLAVVFYRMGKLDKAKIDLTNKSIELETDNNSKETSDDSQS